MAGHIVAMLAVRVGIYSSSRPAPGIASHTCMSSSTAGCGVQWRSYLLFRDILRRDAEARHRYEAIKLKLAEQYPTDRGSYATGKTEVVESLLRGGQ